MLAAVYGMLPAKTSEGDYRKEFSKRKEATAKDASDVEPSSLSKCRLGEEDRWCVYRALTDSAASLLIMCGKAKTTL